MARQFGPRITIRADGLDGKIVFGKHTHAGSIFAMNDLAA